MFYIHQNHCISPQQTFSDVDINSLRPSTNNILTAVEPAYAIAANTLRRMGKASRIGMGSAMPLIQHIDNLHGMIIASANGGMEESIRFLKQIIEYDEDMLAPGSFVQSTANAIASQLGMFIKNHGYNITHVHKGLAFENAVIDASMLLAENASHTYLLGGVDEIASYNYQVECSAGWYKKENISNSDLYATDTPGSIAGEGAAMFIVNNQKENAVAQLRAIRVLHSKDKTYIQQQLQDFIQDAFSAGEQVDLFLTGENGDNRYASLWNSCEALMNIDTTIARYKHMCGEYPTASAFALWLACHLQVDELLPEHMTRKQGARKQVKNILICNSYQGTQHSFMLVSKMV